MEHLIYNQLMNFLIFILSVLSLNSALALSSSNYCLSRLEPKLRSDYQDRLKTYARLDSKFTDIAEINRPHWAPGPKKNEVVFLVHGFMGSPDEMKWVADALLGQGYSVYLGLLPGYGAGARIANQVTYNELYSWYQQQIRLLETCFRKIHLVGFSTGALLAFDYTTSTPEDSKIGSISLISPFFSAHSLWGSLLQKWASKVLATVPVAELEAISHFQDIKVMIKNPRAYLQSVPLLGAGEIVKGGALCLQRRLSPKLETPLLLFLSDLDQVVNQQESEELIRTNFKSVNFVQFGADQRGPHHLMTPFVSPLSAVVSKKISDFITSIRP